MAFILTIREQGSSWAGRDPVTSVHATRHETDAALVDYARENWDSEMDGDDPPAEEDELVRQYFENVPEAYEISQAS